MELIVFIKSSGVNIRKDNLTDTLVSFYEKNMGVDYKFYLIIDESLYQYVDDLFESKLGKDKLLCLKVADSNTWAQDFNLFLDEYGESSEWLLISHDDVSYVTDNYFKKMIEPVSHMHDKLGWMTSTSDHYYNNIGELRVDTFRPGFHLDHNKWPCMFQIHNASLTDIDYPKGPVYIHGPMSAVMLVRMQTMKKIGYCEDWTPYTMMVDEDWSLTALKNNFRNVWIPDVHHQHPLRWQNRKAKNRWTRAAHRGMHAKWGFIQAGSIAINDLRERFNDTLIPWSSYRNSYDWEYIDD